MAENLSMNAYAHYRGVSEAAVRKAVRSGRITLNEEGLINPEKADREWEANTRVSLDSQVQEITYAELRKKHLALKYEKEKFEFEHFKNQYMRKKEVAALAHRHATEFKKRLWAIPHKVAEVLASTQDPKEIERRLCEEYSYALEVFDWRDP